MIELGNTIKVLLTEEDYNTLVERFDLENVQLIRNKFTIYAPCICRKYMGNGNCGKCPFEPYYNYVTPACEAFMFLENIKHSNLMLRQEKVFWFDLLNNNAREEIEAIRVYLLKNARQVSTQEGTASGGTLP